jgi:DNA-binding NarL/FixJ family response regulator
MAQALVEDSESLAGWRGNGGNAAVAAGAVALLSLDPDPVALNRLKRAISRTGRKVSAVLTDPGDASAGMPRVLVVGGTSSISALRDALQRVRRSSGETSPVVVLSNDSRAAVRALVESGADGVVFESDVQRALEPTITAVEAGQIAVPAERRRDVDRPTLSRREKQTLGLVVMGLSNREIASRLFVAESTVKCHLSAAFVKLGVRSRHEAVSVILDPERGIGLGILRISEAERRTLEARS